MPILAEDIRQDLVHLADRSDCLLFGEVHGTQEVPQLLAELLDGLMAVGYEGLALEVPRTQQQALMSWAQGKTNAVPLFFAEPDTDGRGNAQALALVHQAVSKGWKVLCFDADTQYVGQAWRERDKTMASNLAAEWIRSCPGRKVVGVCGNLHSRLVASTGQFAELWPSFAAWFGQSNPQYALHSISIVFHGGFFFNGEVRPIHGEVLASAELREEPERGHTIALHLPRATPATFVIPPIGTETGPNPQCTMPPSAGAMSSDEALQHERTLRSELEQMYDTDQTGRLEIREVQQRPGKESLRAHELWTKLQDVDAKNQARLERIIQKHGWPGRSLVGDKASVAAFLVLQHADLALQERYLPLLKKATAEGELKSEYLPLMEDRILMRQGKKQIYGTQLNRGSEGNPELWPIDDEPEVDRRRTAVGLEPLATYLKRFGLEYVPKA